LRSTLHFFPLPVSGPSQAGFTHFPIGSHVYLPLLLSVPTSRSTSWHNALHPEDGSSKVLQNVSILLQHNMVSQPRRPWLELPVTKTSVIRLFWYLV